MKQELSFVFICFAPLLGFAQDGILVDGIFEDWSGYPAVYNDPGGDGGPSDVDFGTLQMNHDDAFLFFKLEIGTEINLQDYNAVALYLDTDNNSNTGLSMNGIGAELVYYFGERTGYFFYAGSEVEIDHEDIFLITAPTVTSNVFEIAIHTDVVIAGIPVFQADTVKVVFHDDIFSGDFLPDANESILYVLSDLELGPLPNYAIQKHPEVDIRVVSYNVLSNGFFEAPRTEYFTRILQAIEPDIIGFQEIYDYTSSQVAFEIENMLPSASGQDWYHAKAGPDCHAISRYPIVKSTKIQGQNSSSGNGAFLIDIPAIDSDALLIVAHPPCCDNNSGRQKEVDLIMEFVREAKEGKGPISIEPTAPIIILGDMNLVGDHQQLKTLLTGDIVNENAYGEDFDPDWDGNPLLDSNPYVTGLPFNYTWYDEGSSFSPGKLDYIIYSGSNLILQNQFSLFTPSLPQDSLTAYGLFKNDAVNASDHLPLVTDFEFKFLVNTHSDLDKNAPEITLYPNPFSESFEVFIAGNNHPISYQLLNPRGQVILEGSFIDILEVADLTDSGIYILRLTVDGQVISKRIVKSN